MLKLTTFGGLSLSRDGQPMTGAAAQRSRLALLALLASAGPAGISRDKLLLYLWPESDSERARHALKQAVYALRRDLGDEETIQGTASLSLNSALIESDIREFEAALAKGDRATAVALYTGAFLDGVYIKEAPEFERWCAEMRTRLSQDWAKAVEGLARDCEAKGEWRDAVSRWRQLAAAEPLSGRNTMLLMRALAESGDTSAALAQYRVHESLMQQEMESPPDPEVAKLADDMRQGRWQRSAPVAMTAPPIATHASPVASGIAISAEPLASAPVAQAAPPRRGVRLALAAVALALVLGVMAIATSEDRRAQLAQIVTLKTRPDAKPLDAVLIVPFVNETGDSSWNSLAAGVAEWIRRGLSAQGLVPVVGGRDVRLMDYAVSRMPGAAGGKERGLAIAREFGADTAIEGSIYKRGDSLEVLASVVEVSTGRVIKSIPAVRGPARRDATGPLIDAASNAAIVVIYGMKKKSPAATTAALTRPPSLDAFDALDEGYVRFFNNVSDTAGVFAMYDTAIARAPDFAGPYVIKAYMRDVKGNFPGLAEMMPRLRKLRPLMTRPEQKALDMFAADLAGQPYARLRAARELNDLSPGSPEMPILVAVSELYVGHPDSAMAAFSRTDGNRGINLGSPVYWGWLAVAQHFAGDSVGEKESVERGVVRFPHSRLVRWPQVAEAARRGDTVEINAALRATIDDDGNAELARRELMLLAGRELRAHNRAALARPYFELASKAMRDNPISNLRARTQEANVLYELEDWTAAREKFLAIRKTNPSVDIDGRLGAIAVRLGDTAEAAKIDSALAKMTDKYLLGRNTKWRAHIAALLKRTADAILLLQTATKEGYRLMDTAVIDVHHDFDFVDLVKAPEYAGFLKEMAATNR